MIMLRNENEIKGCTKRFNNYKSGQYEQFGNTLFNMFESSQFNNIPISNARVNFLQKISTSINSTSSVDEHNY